MLRAQPSISSRLVPTALRLLSVCRMSATSAPAARARGSSFGPRISIMRHLPPASAGGHLGDLAAQLEHGLRVHLADARLGDAEHLTDLGQREALVVVEGDDDLLALGQLVDRPGEQVLRLLARAINQ